MPMSVVKGDLGLSDKEFWKLSLKIEAEITVVLLHDFGIKPKLYTIENYAAALHMEAEDAAKFHAICAKYGVSQIKLDFPAWKYCKRRTQHENHRQKQKRPNGKA